MQFTFTSRWLNIAIGDTHECAESGPFVSNTGGDFAVSDRTCCDGVGDTPYVEPYGEKFGLRGSDG